MGPCSIVGIMALLSPFLDQKMITFFFSFAPSESGRTVDRPILDLSFPYQEFLVASQVVTSRIYAWLVR